MLLAAASPANSRFHVSNPAAELPHCAARASPAMAIRTIKVAKTTLLYCLRVDIQNSLCLSRSAYDRDARGGPNPDGSCTTFVGISRLPLGDLSDSVGRGGAVATGFAADLPASRGDV